MSFLAYEDTYYIENFYPREGIRRLSFNKFKYKSGPFEDKSSIVYLSNTEEPLRRLKNERKNIVILSESFRQDRDNYICCFIHRLPPQWRWTLRICNSSLHTLGYDLHNYGYSLLVNYS